MRRLSGILLAVMMSVTCSAQLDLKALKEQSQADAMNRKAESEAGLSRRRQNWDAFLEQRKEEWGRIVSKRDLEWTDFLSDSEWTVFEDFLKFERPQRQKPVVMPEAEPLPEPEPGVPVIPKNEPIVVPQDSIVISYPLLPIIIKEPVAVVPTVIEPVKEPQKPVIEPVKEPVTEPVKELEEPVTEPVTEPAKEPVTEPVKEPEKVAEPEKPVRDVPVITPPIIVPPVITPPVITPPVTVPDDGNELRKEIEKQPDALPCKPSEPDDGLRTAAFAFYGNSQKVMYDTTVKNFKFSKFGQKDIANFWKETSETNYTPTVEKLLEAKDEIGLSDWGFYMFVNEFAKSVFSSKDVALLYTWFLLVRAGFDVKVGYTNTSFVLMLPSETVLYEIDCIAIDGKRYYVIQSGAGSGVRTYRGSYAGGNQLGVEQRQSLTLGGNLAERNVTFKFKKKEYSMSFSYDPDLIEYYKALPQAQFEVFFNSSPSDALKESIARNLKPVVSEMNMPDAMNFLLRFVQLSLPYKTDPEQFGKEKYFYADELFAYPYCDCEDRSVLYTYLVHTLLGVDAVGTEFPGHMATAVSVDYPVDGVSYDINGRKFIMADPTYMNSSVGQCIPKYETTAPKIHLINFAE